MIRSTSKAPPRWPSLAACLVIAMTACVPRAVLFIGRLQQFEVLGPAAWGGSDVPGHLGMAYHLAGQGDLSYWLMGARPPLSPATIALVLQLGGSLPLAAAVQAVFGVLTIVIGFIMAHRILAPIVNQGWVFAAGMMMALDPAAASISASLMTEPLFNLLITAFILFTVLYVQTERWWHTALAALSLALAMLARPSAIYLWIVVPLIIIPLARRKWRFVLPVAVVGLLVYLAWSYRNWYYTGVFTYSLQANFSLLFLRAISAEHLATGASVADLYIAYVRELYTRVGNLGALGTVTDLSFWDFHVASTPELYAQMGSLAIEKLLKYWPIAVMSTPLGLWRMYALTTDLPGWFTPVELVYHAVIYSTALYGAIQGIRSRRWALVLTQGVPILYFTSLTLVAQISAMTSRMRTPITAPIIILATYGMHQLWQKTKEVHILQPRLKG